MPGKPDAAGIGQDKSVQDPYDALPGKYDDAVYRMPDDQRLPTGALPKAPDPSPFTINGGVK